MLSSIVPLTVILKALDWTGGINMMDSLYCLWLVSLDYKCVFRHTLPYTIIQPWWEEARELAFSDLTNQLLIFVISGEIYITYQQIIVINAFVTYLLLCE